MSEQKFSIPGQEENISSEKIFFKNSRGLKLVGDFYPSNNKSVVIMCHGLAGNRFERGLFDRAARQFNSAGLNVFKFDFSGCGESDDDILSTDKMLDDLQAALKQVRIRGLKRIGLLDCSFGAFISAKSIDREIGACVSWAPVTNSAVNPEAYYGDEGLRELKDKGYITRVREDGIRPKGALIGLSLFEDWKRINQQKLLSSINIPILIVYGNKDTRIPLDDSKNAMQYLSPESRLQIVDGVDHYLNAQTDNIISQTVDWFKKYLLSV